jgi:pilus assembly protein CpaB
MNNRRIPLIIGLVLALGTGALLLTYLMSLRPTAVATKPVVVATRDIPARAVITNDFVVVQQRNATETDSDAIGNPKDVVGKYTLVSIPAGSVVSASKIGLSSASTLPAKLPVGMRAMSISIDNVKAVAGLITPGDRVDVIAIPPRSGAEAVRGYTILRGTLVLAMGTDLQTTTATPSPGGASPSLSTVTLALTPNQADLLAGADVNTVLRLALRNPKEAIRAFPPELLKLPSLAVAPSNSAPAATVPIPMQAYAMAPPGAQSPAQRQAANASRPGVTVIDGDRVIAGAGAQR